MARILVLIVLGFILVQLLKRFVSSATKLSDKAEEKLEEKMIQCANCGCHAPQSESILKNNKIICNNPECQH